MDDDTMNEEEIQETGHAVIKTFRLSAYERLGVALHLVGGECRPEVAAYIRERMEQMEREDGR